MLALLAPVGRVPGGERRRERDAALPSPDWCRFVFIRGFQFRIRRLRCWPQRIAFKGREKIFTLKNLLDFWIMDDAPLPKNRRRRTLHWWIIALVVAVVVIWWIVGSPKAR
jgi:hypothetical protein